MFSKKRDIGSLVWEDPLAWMEKMKGAEWKNLIQSETNQFNALVNRYLHPHLIQTVQDELFLADEAEATHPYIVQNHVMVWLSSMTSLDWQWINSDMKYSVNDLAVDKQGNIWQVTDAGSGSETYRLAFHKHLDYKPTWTLSNLGPYVIVIGNVCFFLEAKNNLWYYRLSCVNAYTGKGYKVIYEEKDAQWNLSLQKAENETAYLIRENSGLQQAFFFVNEHLKELPIEGFFVLGGGAPNDYFATPGRGTDDWKGYGPRLSRWHLPEKGIPEFVWVHQGLLVTRKQGERTLWKCSTQHPPKQLLHGIHKFKLNLFGIFYNDKHATFTCMTPGSFSIYYEYKANELHSTPPIMPDYGTVERHFAGDVPYFLIQPCKRKPTALLVVGYGAYGLSTAVSTARWYPLLLRGWAVAIALVRGGGDDTMAWANAARTWRRKASIQDFESVIQAAQKKCGLSSAETAVYGRSAGGILVGGAAARQKGTSLFKALYAEVPYLDLLRTTTNPNLPLTKLEYDEFGNPTERLEDLVSLAKISPIDQIPEKGYPGLFALMRTGENDKEVFAYEPVKWILRSRGKQRKDTTKILAFQTNEGHFVGGFSGLQNRAIDLCFLLAWQKKATFRI